MILFVLHKLREKDDAAGPRPVPGVRFTVHGPPTKCNHALLCDLTQALPCQGSIARQSERCGLGVAVPGQLCSWRDRGQIGHSLQRKGKGSQHCVACAGMSHQKFRGCLVLRRQARVPEDLTGDGLFWADRCSSAMHHTDRSAIQTLHLNGRSCRIRIDTIDSCTV